MKYPELGNSYIINAAATTAMAPSTANPPRLWLASPVVAADGFALVAELAAEDAEVVAVEPAEEAEGVPRELLVAAMKGPMTPPCCCAGAVLFEVLAAFALKAARDSDVLELLFFLASYTIVLLLM